MRHIYQKLAMNMSVFYLAGCATMLAQPKTSLRIESEPSGAEVLYGAKSLGTTPLTVNIPIEISQQHLQVRLAGYAPQVFRIDKTLQTETIYNLGFIFTSFGISSFATDLASGAMFRYAPDSYLLTLVPISTGAKAPQSGRILAVVQFEALRQDVAQGGGPTLLAWHAANADPRSVEGFLNIVRQKKAELVNCNNGLELHEKLLQL